MASKDLIKSTIMIMAVLFIILLMYGCEKPVCGNGKLDMGETILNCCEDAGCPSDQACISNECVDRDHDKTKEDYQANMTNIKDVEIKDAEIKDAEKNMQDDAQNSDNDQIDSNDSDNIIEDECTFSTDCDDNDPSTKEKCMGTPKRCFHEKITECGIEEGYCPEGCSHDEDRDCDECSDNEDCDDNDYSTEDICEGSNPALCTNEVILECADNDDYCPPECAFSDDNDCEQETEENYDVNVNIASDNEYEVDEEFDGSYTVTNSGDVTHVYVLEMIEKQGFPERFGGKAGFYVGTSTVGLHAFEIDGSSFIGGLDSFRSAGTYSYDIFVYSCDDVEEKFGNGCEAEYNEVKELLSYIAHARKDITVTGDSSDIECTSNSECTDTCEGCEDGVEKCSMTQGECIECLANFDCKSNYNCIDNICIEETQTCAELGGCESNTCIGGAIVRSADIQNCCLGQCP